jgi:hypothetical protein
MADPDGYEPQYDFSNYQATNPSKPLPGHELDVELHNISDAIGGTIDALADIRRPDGALKNNIVTADSLAPSAVAVLGPNGDLTAEALAAAEDAARPTVTVSYLTVAGLYFFCVEQAEFRAVEIDDAQMRAEVERCVRAARAVREDHPWWRAYLHELGMGADEIARGFTVSHDNRADVLFERRAGVFALDASGPTLRGLL